MDDPRVTTNQALEVLRTQSLAQAIRQEIERMILGGELKAGDKVNESRLAKRLSVSRGPIREALRSLEHSGLAEVVVNRGVFVRELSRQEALDVYDIRASLAGLAARTLAERITSEQVAVLTALVERMEQVCDFDAYYPLNLEFHARIMAFSGNARLAALYQGCVNELHLFRRQSLVQGGGLQVSNREHRGVLEALRTGDAERAARLMERHIRAGKQRFLNALGAAEAAEREEGHEDQERTGERP